MAQTMDNKINSTYLHNNAETRFLLQRHVFLKFWVLFLDMCHKDIWKFPVHRLEEIIIAYPIKVHNV